MFCDHHHILQSIILRTTTTDANLVTFGTQYGEEAPHNLGDYHTTTKLIAHTQKKKEYVIATKNFVM